MRSYATFRNLNVEILMRNACMIPLTGTTIGKLNLGWILKNLDFEKVGKKSLGNNCSDFFKIKIE